MRKRQNPFAKHTPSIFVVYTPFQVLCAVATIRQLEIENYKVLTLFPKGEVRNNQTKTLLEKYNIQYKEAIVFSRVSVWLYIAFSFIWRKNSYKRLFLGDLRALFTYFIGFNHVSNDSSVVFLDDGNITINILQGHIAEPMSKSYERITKSIARFRNIDVGHNFLTIYGDIKSPQNRVCQLNLQTVVDGNQSSIMKQKNIYIIGTNVARFCKPLEIPNNVYIQKLGELMHDLRQKYPYENIYFIPHGREVLHYGEKLCKQYGCIFLRPQMMVELELLNMPLPPKIIIGYTSTALFTLKKIFPFCRVINILFDSSKDNPFYKDYYMCSEYYSKNGIEWVNEPLSLNHS